LDERSQRSQMIDPSWTGTFISLPKWGGGKNVQARFGKGEGGDLFVKDYLVAGRKNRPIGEGGESLAVHDRNGLLTEREDHAHGGSTKNRRVPGENFLVSSKKFLGGH